MSGTKSPPKVGKKWRETKLAKQEARRERSAIMVKLKKAQARHLRGLLERTQEAKLAKIADADKRAEKKAKLLAQVAPFYKMVNKLSNWQRNQWARDGYPGLFKEYDADKVKPYTKLQRVNMWSEQERSNPNGGVE